MFLGHVGARLSLGVYEGLGLILRDIGDQVKVGCRERALGRVLHGT